MFQLPFSVLSPAGKRARLTILIFHRVLSEPDAMYPGEPDAIEFETRMRWIRDWFHVLRLSEAVTMLYEGTLPSRALAITFDDGYANNEAVAAPILQKLGLTATFFVTTGFLDGEVMWNDKVTEAVRACAEDELDLAPLGLPKYKLSTAECRQRAMSDLVGKVKYLEVNRRRDLVDAVVEAAGAPALPSLMVNPAQLRRLRQAGMEIGAHTVTHPILSRLSRAAARDEIGRSKETLEHILGERIGLFAYPNGVPMRDYRAEHVDLVRECGFDAAVSTAASAASVSSNRFQLPRFTPWDRTRVRYGARLALNLTRTEVSAS